MSILRYEYTVNVSVQDVTQEVLDLRVENAVTQFPWGGPSHLFHNFLVMATWPSRTQPLKIHCFHLNIVQEPVRKDE